MWYKIFIYLLYPQVFYVWYFQGTKASGYICLFCIFQLDTVIPFTFPTVDSYLELSSVTGSRLRVGFNFRTYNWGGLLFVHTLSPGGRAMVRNTRTCALIEAIKIFWWQHFSLHLHFARGIFEQFKCKYWSKAKTFDKFQDCKEIAVASARRHWCGPPHKSCSFICREGPSGKYWIKRDARHFDMLCIIVVSSAAQ